MRDTVIAALGELVPDARTLLVAVSGGGDSVALLRVLLGGPYHLQVGHFDHALRPESAAEALFVRDLCGDLGVPFHTERAEVRRIAELRGWNLEDAARRLRYSFLARTAKRVGAEAVATAHTRDDQAETVLLQLLRGAAQLRGMARRRGAVVRPLLRVSRAELRAYLQETGQPWLEDPSNTDTARTRAWLRREVIPRLEARYPQVQRTLARYAELQRDQAEVLESRARTLVTDGGLELDALRAEPPALQRTALALLLKDAGVPPDAEHLERLRAALSKTAPHRLALPRGKMAQLAYGRLEVTSHVPPTPAPAAQSAETLPLEVDPAKLAGFPPLFYRTRLPGDRIRLAGGSKKLSDLLIDRKVPQGRRDALRLLATAAAEPAEVLWAEGVATDVRVARVPPNFIQNDTVQDDPDARWMRRALTLAEEASAAGEVPVGAVVVRGDALLAEAVNTTRADGDPTAHAELTALRVAARVLGDWRLDGCTLYVTLEPCPMCFGGMLAAHLPRLVYGAPNHREGALGGVADLRRHDWKRGLEVRGGVLAAEAARLLSAFFDARRAAEPHRAT